MVITTLVLGLHWSVDKLHSNHKQHYYLRNRLTIFFNANILLYNIAWTRTAAHITTLSIFVCLLKDKTICVPLGSYYLLCFMDYLLARRVLLATCT